MSPENKENKANWASRKQIDFHRCYNECEAMFLAGNDLPAIAERYEVSQARLEEWREQYFWDRKLAAMLTAPKGIGAMLREKLRQQVQAQLEADQIDGAKVEEITKLTKCIKEIEGFGVNVLAATVEVLQGFSVFIRKNISDRDTYSLVSSWVQEYLRSLADV